MPSQNSKRSGKKRPVKKVTIRIGGAIFLILVSIFLIGKFVTAPSVEYIGGDVKKVAAKEQVKKTKKLVNPKKISKKRDEKVVYLTFDDGPSILTGKFLDVLKEHNIKATFFMQGINLKNENLQDDVKRATKEGHYVGGHSMTHQYKTLYNKGQFVPEMKETLSLIHQITGTTPHLVRPPYGSVPGLKNNEIRNQIAKEGIKIWDWTIESEDWSLKNNPNKIVENIKNHTTERVEVVLMHEKPQTLQVLPEVIAFFKEKGYTFKAYRDADHFRCNFLKDDRF